MSRVYGTVSIGLRAPIIRQGDDLTQIVTGSIVDAMNEEGLVPGDRDVVCMTEAIVARAQGNYASVDNIAKDVKNKLGFSMCVFPSWADNYTTNGTNTAADRLEEAEDVLAAGYVNQTFIRVDENFEKMMALSKKYDCQFWIGASASAHTSPTASLNTP